VVTIDDVTEGEAIEDAARSVSAGVSGNAAATLERLGPTVKSALAELRRISMNLRPSTLDDPGILATLSWCFFVNSMAA